MIEEILWQGIKIFELQNNRLRARISPLHGANLFDLLDKKSEQPLLRTPSSPQELFERPQFFGIPNLLPPNRLKGGKFTWQGETFEFPKNDGHGNHIHGVVMDKPWRFSHLEDSDEHTSLTLTLDVVDHVECYQALRRKLKLSVTITLEDAVCKHQFVVENLDTKAVPIGYGAHTWFHLAGGRSAWNITVPFEKIWELDEEILPTGAFLSGEKIKALATGLSLKEKKFDTILFRGKHDPLVSLEAATGMKILYCVSDAFKHWVLHTPDDDPNALAIEPYSWITNAPNLALDPSDTGLSVLGPGDSAVFTQEISLSSSLVCP
jgi:aldose 1-epimerase